MNYWDIRKRKQLKHLPAPDPELVRAGVSESDQNYLRSRGWMELYHQSKKEPPDDQSSKEDTHDGLMADADASRGRSADPSSSEEATGSGIEFAPR